MIREEGLVLKYEIGTRIKKFREMSNISQIELAKRLGVSNSRISNWEQGINRPDADMISKICIVLSVSPSDLLDIKISPAEYTIKEKEVLNAYRSKPELRHAVHVLLGIEDR